MHMSTAGPSCVLFAGGGTGGHLFPGIAVAREIVRRRPRTTVVFAGAGRALEARVLAHEGFALEPIRTGGLVGQSFGALIRGLALIPVSLVDATRLLRRHAPSLVVGLGGYSSGPVVLAAARRGLPTLLLEQNVVPGMTNRLLVRVVRAAAVSYEATLPYFGTKGFVSGNPVRQGFFEAPPPRRSPPDVHLLVVGGSQGAHAINVAMVEAAATLLASPRPIRLTHQSGEHDLDFVREGYRAAGLSARVEPFLDGMDREVATADLIVCRAGATTLAEVAAAGRPAILVPFPHATHDHQHRNAAVLGEAGAADVTDPQELSGAVLGARVISLVLDDARRVAIAEASRRFARPEAAGVIVDRMERWFDPERSG